MNKTIVLLKYCNLFICVINISTFDTRYLYSLNQQVVPYHVGTSVHIPQGALGLLWAQMDKPLCKYLIYIIDIIHAIFHYKKYTLCKTHYLLLFLLIFISLLSSLRRLPNRRG